MFNLYLYNFKISFKRRVTHKVKHNIKSQDYIGRFKHYWHFVKCTLSRLSNCYIKPSLTLEYSINLGLTEASETAIVFGMLNEFPPIIYSNLNKFFTIKNYKFHISPNFEEEKIYFNLNSILTISIANTLYIAIIILFYFIKDKKAHNFFLNERKV